MNHELGAAEKFQQLIDDLVKPWLIFEIRSANAVDALGTFVNVSIRIQKSMIFATRQASIDEFEATDFNNAVTLGG